MLNAALMSALDGGSSSISLTRMTILHLGCGEKLWNVCPLVLAQRKPSPISGKLMPSQSSVRVKLYLQQQDVEVQHEDSNAAETCTSQVTSGCTDITSAESSCVWTTSCLEVMRAEPQPENAHLVVADGEVPWTARRSIEYLQHGPQSFLPDRFVTEAVIGGVKGALIVDDVPIVQQERKRRLHVACITYTVAPLSMVGNGHSCVHGSTLIDCIDTCALLIRVMCWSCSSPVVQYLGMLLVKERHRPARNFEGRPVSPPLRPRGVVRVVHVCELDICNETAPEVCCLGLLVREHDGSHRCRQVWRVHSRGEDSADEMVDGTVDGGRCLMIVAVPCRRCTAHCRSRMVRYLSVLMLVTFRALFGRRELQRNYRLCLRLLELLMMGKRTVATHRCVLLKAQQLNSVEETFVDLGCCQLLQHASSECS